MGNLYTLLTVAAVASLLGFALVMLFITDAALAEAERERKLAEDAARRWDAFEAEHRNRG